jgi:hypothetical protein
MKTLTVVAMLAASSVLLGCSLKNTADPPGDLRRWGPIANLAAVAAYAGDRPELVKMTAMGLASNPKCELAKIWSAPKASKP